MGLCDEVAQCRLPAAVGLGARSVMRLKKKGASSYAAIEGKILNWELKQTGCNQRFSQGKILIQAPQQNHHLSRATAQPSEPSISSPKWAAGNRQHRSFGRSWICSCAHVLPALPMKVSVILRLQKKSWFLTTLNLQDFTASSTPHAGAKDKNSELREGAAGGSLGRNRGINLQFLRFKLHPSCVYYSSKCSAKSREMKAIRCSFKPHKGSISKDPGGNWFDKHPFRVLTKERVPSKHPGTTRWPYRASGSCPAEQG